MAKTGYRRPPALSRDTVERKCPTPDIAPRDDRGTGVRAPQTTRYVVRMSGTPDATGARSGRTAANRRAREARAIDRSFRTTGVAPDIAGRGRTTSGRIDAPSAAERADLDARIKARTHAVSATEERVSAAIKARREARAHA